MLIVFLIKIIWRKIIDFVKTNTLIFIILTIILFSLAYLKIYPSLLVNKQIFNILIFILLFITFINLNNNINSINNILNYKNTNLTNKNIYNIKIIVKSIKTSIPLFIFYIFMLLKIIKLDIGAINHKYYVLSILILLFIFTICNKLIHNIYKKIIFYFLEIINIWIILYQYHLFVYFSLLVYSIIIIYLLKYNNMIYFIDAINIKIKLPVIIKASINEYLIFNLVQPLIILFCFFIFILYSTIISNNFITIDRKSIIACLLPIIIIFYLFVDAIPNTRWYFYSIINPSIKFQIKKVLLFYLILFLLPVCICLFFIIIFDIKYLFFYLSYILLNILFSIFIGFLTCGIITKGIIGLGCLFVSSLFIFSGNVLLFILIFPLIILINNSINNHYRWYLL